MLTPTLRRYIATLILIVALAAWAWLALDQANKGEAFWFVVAWVMACVVGWGVTDAANADNYLTYDQMVQRGGPTRVVTTHTTKMRSGPGAPPPITTTKVDYE